MRKIGWLSLKEFNLSFYYDEKEKYNHYKIYKEYRDYNTDKWPGYIDRKRLLNKYADLNSLGYLVYDIIRENNEEERGV